MRKASMVRETKETYVESMLLVDGNGECQVETGVGFFDHMLQLFAFHSQMDLLVKAKGDLDVCDHHTIEDIGIVLGTILKDALGNKKGINRYGSFTLPMDEVLCNVTLDISNRPYLVFNCPFTREKVGEMSTEMVEEFFRAVCVNAGITLHINVYYGNNDHHKIEAIFKAFARALKQACTITSDKLQSSKGAF